MLDSQPRSLQELVRAVILQNVLQKERGDIKDLESLPIPKVLIKYLKYYRDQSMPKPQSTKKRRRSYDNSDSDDDEEEEGIGGHIRFRVVIR